MYSERALGRDLRPIPWNDYHAGRIAEYSRVHAISAVDIVDQFLGPKYASKIQLQ